MRVRYVELHGIIMFFMLTLPSFYVLLHNILVFYLKSCDVDVVITVNIVPLLSSDPIVHP